MQFSVQREQTFYFFPITSPTDVLHFFLFSLFSPVTVLASKLNLYRIITDILTQRYTQSTQIPRWEIRFRTLCWSCLRIGDADYFFTINICKRGPPKLLRERINQRIARKDESVERKRGIDFYFPSLSFSTIRRAYILYKYCNRLRLKTARIKMMRKAKRTRTKENEGKKKMWCIVIRDTTRETGEKAFSWWRETFLSDREQSTRYRSRNNSRKRGKLRILVRKSLEKGRRGKKKKKKLKISLLFLS